MKSPWHNPITLDSIEDNWDSSPDSAGVYIIMVNRPVSRIGDIDNKGIIYIGQTKNLRERLSAFLYQNHTASGFLWAHKAVAQIVLDEMKLNLIDLKKHLRKLNVKYSTPIAEGSLGEAERALIFTYIAKYGEPPPLNMSLPKRWNQPPPPQDQEWAEKGLFI